VDEEPAMSREALSLEISQVVSRVVSGEQIDVAEQSIMLALKYPDLGMSGEMIGEAITRAASMVGMIKSAPAPVAWPVEPTAAKESALAHANGDVDESLAGAARAIKDELASTTDAEIGSLIAGQAADTDAKLDGETHAAPAPDAGKKSRRGGPVAALLSLFRS
jgi:hypothetical protein